MLFQNKYFFLTDFYAIMTKDVKVNFHAPDGGTLRVNLHAPGRRVHH